MEKPLIQVYITPRKATLMSQIQSWSQIRQSFYAKFTASLGHNSELVSSPPRVCWSDFSGAYNHIWLYPFLSPTPSYPHLPWLARLSVNILDPMLLPRELGARLNISSWHPDWYLELTALPEELDVFADWLARLADAHDDLWSEHIADPPRKLHRPLSREGLLEAASLWTENALRVYDEFCEAEEQRQQKLRRMFEVQVALAEMQDGSHAKRLLATG
jgi:hypothetical protein